MCRKGSKCGRRPMTRNFPTDGSKLIKPAASLAMQGCQLLGRLRQEDGDSEVRQTKLVFGNKSEKNKGL